MMPGVLGCAASTVSRELTCNTARDQPYCACTAQSQLERVADVFGGTAHKPDAPDLKILHAKIGQLALEHDC
jgi:hypothetical protein